MNKVDVKEFLRLVSAGSPPAAVAAAFGVSPATFTYWRVKLGIPPLRWRACDPRRVRALHAAGMTDRQAAAEMGVHPCSAAVARRKLGLEPNSGRDRPEYRERARAQMRARAATGEVHAARRRAFAADRAALAGRYGLPADLLPAQVAVVLALAGGPLQVSELADATGRRPARRSSGYWRFNYPQCDGGNYLTGLRKRGLVFSVRTGRGSVYSLTPACMDMLTEAGRGQR